MSLDGVKDPCPMSDATAQAKTQKIEGKKALLFKHNNRAVYDISQERNVILHFLDPQDFPGVGVLENHLYVHSKSHRFSNMRG